MRKKDVQHQQRHRKRPSRWRYIFTVVVIFYRIWANAVRIWDWVTHFWE